MIICKVYDISDRSKIFLKGKCNQVTNLSISDVIDNHNKRF